MRKLIRLLSSNIPQTFKLNAKPDLKYFKGRGGSESSPGRKYLPGAWAAGATTLLAMYYFSHLEVVPISGRTRFITMSEKTENEIGEASFHKLAMQYQGRFLSKSHPTYQLVNSIALRLLRVSGFENFKPWSVYVVNDPEMNAFVLPSGHIFVCTGILQVANDQDGLAAVLGHEIVTSRHSAEKLSWLSAFTYLRLALMVIGLDFPPSLTNLTLSLGFLLPFSRDCESEADKIGLQFMAKACFDPKGAISLWKRMEQFGANNGPQLKWFSTHPPNKERIKNMKEWLAEAERIRSLSDCETTRSHLSRFLP